jgi:hypothetical protein
MIIDPRRNPVKPTALDRGLISLFVPQPHRFLFITSAVTRPAIFFLLRYTQSIHKMDGFIQILCTIFSTKIMKLSTAKGKLSTV